MDGEAAVQVASMTSMINAHMHFRWKKQEKTLFGGSQHTMKVNAKQSVIHLALCEDQWPALFNTVIKPVVHYKADNLWCSF
jgi:hypothetical protein